MKNYTITVNGTAYDVTVEEGASSGAPVAAKAPAAPKAAPAAAPKAAPAAPKAAKIQRRSPWGSAPRRSGWPAPAAAPTST